MPTDDLTSELELAVTLVRRASACVLKEVEKGLEVSYKGGDPHNPVTQADLMASDILVEGLIRAFPHDGILTEEDAATHDFSTRQSHRRLWCIDPIDGTRSFVAKSPQYAVMVGLAIDGEARLGVVMAPASAVIWTGIRPMHAPAEAWRWQGEDGRRLNASPQRTRSAPRMVVSSARPTRLIESVAQKMGAAPKRERLASVGLKAMRIAEGEAELYISPSNKTHEWDACGPEAIVRAAGGAFTDMAGAQLSYNKPQTPTRHGLMACHKALHGDLTEAIATTMKGLPRRS